MNQAEQRQQPPEPVCFETHPDRYRHLRLEVRGSIAELTLDIQEDGGLRPGYALKLNSYDLSVDIELADAVRRLRFEHPEVSAVVLRSARPGIFSAGANIFMLGASEHGFKVNFCRFTNETRLEIEDASANSGQYWIAAVGGLASGGGYELALACAEILLVDDHRSAVALPEIPYLGVLPGTGGLTRLVDKRGVRRDLADVFVTLAEGAKGQRAVKWGLVDAVFPPSRFEDSVLKRAKEKVDPSRLGREGVRLGPLSPEISGPSLRYRHCRLDPGPAPRTARLRVEVPDGLPAIPEDPTDLGADWFPLRMWRELDDLLCRLRFNAPDVGLVLVETSGSLETVRALDEAMLARRDHWFVREVLLLGKRVLKRIDVTAKSFFALAGEGSCFGGSLLELALASDRIYMLDAEGVALQITPANAELYPMGSGLSRLQCRLLGEPDLLDLALEQGAPLGAQRAEELGLVTFALDDLDWDEELRLAIEERASLSPDALTGSEASLRFAGPETLETKIFGRLSAWQNWIFQRPNAVGPRGALTLYGRPERAAFDFRRT